MSTWEERGWQQADLDKLELGFLNEMFANTSPHGVEATMAYAAYLENQGVSSDNYPIYFRILEMKNHWVVDALIGAKNPEAYFSHIQPNYFIVKACFAALASENRGGIYEKSMLAYFSILQTTYKNVVEGYRVYPPTTGDINHLSKHLNEDKDQMDPINRNILTILDKVASLIDPGRPEASEDIVSLATQANNIRGKFLDMTKSLRESLPDEILGTSNFAENEVAPTSAG